MPTATAISFVSRFICRFQHESAISWLVVDDAMRIPRPVSPSLVLLLALVIDLNRSLATRSRASVNLSLGSRKDPTMCRVASPRPSTEARVAI